VRRARTPRHRHHWNLSLKSGGGGLKETSVRRRKFKVFGLVMKGGEMDFIFFSPSYLLIISSYSLSLLSNTPLPPKEHR